MLEITKDEKFVYTSYLRFVQMFSEIAKGIDRRKIRTLKSNRLQSSNNRKQKKYIEMNVGKYFLKL